MRKDRNKPLCTHIKIQGILVVIANGGTIYNLP
jgi:hypothetical protein